MILDGDPKLVTCEKSFIPKAGKVSRRRGKRVAKDSQGGMPIRSRKGLLENAFGLTAIEFVEDCGRVAGGTADGHLARVLHCDDHRGGAARLALLPGAPEMVDTRLGTGGCQDQFETRVSLAKEKAPKLPAFGHAESQWAWVEILEERAVFVVHWLAVLASADLTAEDQVASCDSGS